MPADAQLKAKLKQKFGNVSSRTGGKGTARRKKKTVRRSTNTEDKKLQSTLKKLNVNTIPAIEEVNLFQEDAKVIHFTNPLVQASIAANTYVVSGKAETKDLGELLPSILSQLGPSALEDLKHLENEMALNTGGDDDDDDIPDLVEATNFEDISKLDDLEMTLPEEDAEPVVDTMEPELEEIS